MLRSWTLPSAGVRRRWGGGKGGKGGREGAESGGVGGGWGGGGAEGRKGPRVEVPWYGPGEGRAEGVGGRRGKPQAPAAAPEARAWAWGRSKPRAAEASAGGGRREPGAPERGGGNRALSLRDLELQLRHQSRQGTPTASPSQPRPPRGSIRQRTGLASGTGRGTSKRQGAPAGSRRQGQGQGQGQGLETQQAGRRSRSMPAGCQAGGLRACWLDLPPGSPPATRVDAEEPAPQEEPRRGTRGACRETDFSRLRPGSHSIGGPTGAGTCCVPMGRAAAAAAEAGMPSGAPCRGPKARAASDRGHAL